MGASGCAQSTRVHAPIAYWGVCVGGGKGAQKRDPVDSHAESNGSSYAGQAAFRPVGHSARALIRRQPRMVWRTPHPYTHATHSVRHTRWDQLMLWRPSFKLRVELHPGRS